MRRWAGIWFRQHGPYGSVRVECARWGAHRGDRRCVQAGSRAPRGRRAWDRGAISMRAGLRIAEGEGAARGVKASLAARHRVARWWTPRQPRPSWWPRPRSCLRSRSSRAMRHRGLVRSTNGRREIVAGEVESQDIVGPGSPMGRSNGPLDEAPILRTRRGWSLGGRDGPARRRSARPAGHRCLTSGSFASTAARRDIILAPQAWRHDGVERSVGMGVSAIAGRLQREQGGVAAIPRQQLGV